MGDTRPYDNSYHYYPKRAVVSYTEEDLTNLPNRSIPRYFEVRLECGHELKEHRTGWYNSPKFIYCRVCPPSSVSLVTRTGWALKRLGNWMEQRGE